MSVKYHLKAKEILKRINPEEIGLDYTSIQRFELSSSISFNTECEEVCLVCIEGEAEYTCCENTGKAVLMDMIYIPCKTEITLSSKGKAVLIRYGAPSDLVSRFEHICFADIDKDEDRHKVYGKKETNCLRDVWNYIDENFESSRLLMGICRGDMGGWTAWPPHEHAEKREEVYVYFNMGNAFGIQCVYEDINNPLVVAMVRNGDLVSVPCGYHPSVGCPAGSICYIYCMVSKRAGDRSFMDLNIQEIYGNKFE